MKEGNKIKKVTKAQRGITLIALVITVVVMLIFAGVTINLTLGQNGIFTTAQKVAQNYTQAQNQEKAGIDSFISAVDKVASGKIYHATDSVGNKIPVPVGFSPITTSDQGTKDTGFVIENDTDRNEFVWVPVGSVANYQRVGWWRDDWTYRQTLKANGEITRADTTDVWTETMPLDEQTSINIYGGFYIGRYEAGVINATENIEGWADNIAPNTNWTSWTVGDDIKLVIQDDKQVWNYITRDKAKEVAEGLYNKNKDNVISKLCSSYAWDSALKFIENQNSTYPTNSAGGNYKGGTGLLQLTGYHKVNNIYDMGGNTWEWTTESCSITTHHCVARGGSISYAASDNPAAFRGRYSTTRASSNFGFRVTLFM